MALVQEASDGSMTETRDEAGWLPVKTMKRDLFGEIQLGRREPEGPLLVRRLTRRSAWLVRPLARLFAWREMVALRRLAGLRGVPQLVAYRGHTLYRSFIPGRMVYSARPRDPAFYAACRALLRQVHRRGVTHNDAAKRVNWLVQPDGQPALIDFQLSLTWRRRSKLFRLFAYEDLRHALKHKRFNCGPGALTRAERRVLGRKSLMTHAWNRLYQGPYFFLTRRILHWQDREGFGPHRNIKDPNEPT
jgi:hypothetical protein